MLGPVVCGLSLRDSAIVILTFSLLCTLPPAYFSTLGPKTGMRQMVQARYSFGYVEAPSFAVRNLLTTVVAGSSPSPSSSTSRP
jgi:purine-cytosine permease-like protein